MELECECRDSLWGEKVVYTCVIKAASITTPGTLIKSIKGVHDQEKDDSSVAGLCFKNHTVVKYIPKGLPKIFKNLTHFGVVGTGLKSLSKEDFSGMENLVWVSFYDNVLKTLPNNLFEGMTKLQTISFKNNLLFNVDSKLLLPIKSSVQAVSFLGNPKIDEIFKKGKQQKVKHFMKALDRISAAETRYRILDERFDKFDKACIEQEKLIVDLKIQLEAADKKAAKLETRAEKAESHLSKFEEFYERQKYCDFAIVVHDKEYKVHQNVLAAKSSVFDEIFTDETPVALSTMKKIKNFSVGAFEDFLHFFYSSRVRNRAYAMELLVLATEFKVHDLKSACEEIVMETLNPDTAWEIFNFAIAHKSDVLGKAAFGKITKKYPDITSCMYNKPEAVNILMKNNVENEKTK